MLTVNDARFTSSRNCVTPPTKQKVARSSRAGRTFFLVCLWRANHAEEYFFELVRSLLLHIRQHVAVGVQCQHDARVTEPFADNLRVSAYRQQERRATVAKAVEVKSLSQLCGFENRPQMAAQDVARLNREP